jgi:hypothetical protein
MAPPLKKEFEKYKDYGEEWLDHTSKTHPHMFEGTTEPSTSKRTHNSAETATSTKLRRVEQPQQAEASQSNIQADDLQEAMGLTGTGLEQAKGGGGSGGASSEGKPVYHIEKPLSIFDSRVSVYRKSHKFMTFGLAPAVISPPPVTNPYTVLTSYLAEVPWHIPAFYLNQSEFDLLDPGSHVVELSVHVYYRGSTIQFKTAETATTLATLNQINDIAVAHALNKTGQGSNVNFTGFATGLTPPQPMIPTSLNKPIYGPINNYRGMVRDYYGANQSDITNFNPGGDIPKHQIGRQTFLYNYWAQTLIGNATPALPNNLQLGGWPCLADKIQQIDGKTVVNQCVAKSTYKPRQGQLKAPLRTLGHGLPNPALGTTISVPCAGHISNAHNAQVATPAIPDSGGQKLTVTNLNTAYSNDTATDPVFDIYMPIEKSQIARSGYWGQADAHVQPSLHIGVQPIPALSTDSMIPSTSQFNNWTDTRAYWEVVAEMKVKEWQPTAYPYASAPNVPYGENVVFSTPAQTPAVYINPRNDGATFAGLYTTTDPGFPTS